MSHTFLVTGGSGFIGSNYVDRLLGRSEDVIVYDNLSRPGARLNLEWLEKKYGRNAFSLVVGDVRDAARLSQTIRDADVIVHLAAQVAVTTSVVQPREDFETNALGTFNVLEAARLSGRQPAILFASTNKVYGGMEGVAIEEQATRHAYAELPQGISEAQPLDFHSPYGCSKGSADQYIRDYHRIYDLPTVVFRQSCIYGPRQFGVEDQGWVAWFIIAVAKGRPIKIYGDGKQVRDLLYVYDLLDAYDLALSQISKTAGQVYNLGGGPDATISVWQEFKPLLERIFNKEISVEWDTWRPGDQKVYVSDIRKARKELGWSPKVGVEAGVEQLAAWVNDNLDLF